MEEKYTVMITSPLHIVGNFTLDILSVDAGVPNVNVAKDKGLFSKKNRNHNERSLLASHDVYYLAAGVIFTSKKSYIDR